MKKLFALILVIATMAALTACVGGQPQNTEPATEPPALSWYSKDFLGLQQYLIDRSLISYAKLPSTADEAKAKDTATEPTTVASSRSEVYYDILGADDGVRYLLSGNAFIELYDFTNADNETAKKVLADIKDDGKFMVIEGFDELEGVISKSGKYVAVYNPKNGYEYNKITDELSKW